MTTLFVALLWTSLAGGPPPHTLHVDQAEGKAIYNANCRKCHGVTGVPSATMKRQMKKLPTLDQKFVSTLSMHDVVETITKGKGDMKALSGKLTAAQINAVASYVFELAKAKPRAAAEK